MNNFLLICNDVLDWHEQVISSSAVIDARLNSSTWPLYRNTRLQKTIKAGDQCFFYSGGRKGHAHKIVANAVIDEITPAKSTDKFGESQYLGEIPTLKLTLKKIIYFQTPFDFKKHKDAFSFIGASKFWGVYMQGGCKKLTQEDAQLIIECTNT